MIFVNSKYATIPSHWLIQGKFFFLNDASHGVEYGADPSTHTRAYTNKNTHPRKKGTPAVLTEIFIPYKTPFSEPPQSQNLLNHPSALPSSSSAGDKTIKMWI